MRVGLRPLRALEIVHENHFPAGAQFSSRRAIFPPAHNFPAGAQFFSRSSRATRDIFRCHPLRNVNFSRPGRKKKRQVRKKPSKKNRSSKAKIIGPCCPATHPAGLARDIQPRIQGGTGRGNQGWPRLANRKICVYPPLRGRKSPLKSMVLGMFWGTPAGAAPGYPARDPGSNDRPARE